MEVDNQLHGKTDPEPEIKLENNHTSTVSVKEIVQSYNEAIERSQCPTSKESSEDLTICGIETAINHNVSQRLRKKDILDDEDDDEPEPFNKLMCGCRLTSLVLFVMFILNISTPSGSEFQNLYRKIRGNFSPNVREVVSGHISKRKMDELIEGVDQYIKSELESDCDVNIVYIYKLISTWGQKSWSLVHSFIIRNNHGKYELISSWYSGGESSATSLIYNTFTFDELKGTLTLESLLDRGKCEKIFGEGNYFEKDNDLVILFISKDGILNGLNTDANIKKAKNRYTNNFGVKKTIVKGRRGGGLKKSKRSKPKRRKSKRNKPKRNKSKKKSKSKMR